jgi:DnaK suppressor protein
MPQLTQAQIDHLTRLMQERFAQLRREIGEVRERAGEHPYAELADVPDHGDESTADLLIDIDNAMVHRDVQEIREIEAALQRISEGSYGECAECGLDIDYGRLQAFPAATRCLACQGQREKTYVQAGRPSL